MITEILAGVAAKLAGLSVAAKAGVGIGVAAATITTAGVTGVVPVPGLDLGDTPPAVEVQLPDVPTPDAEVGLQTANDAISGQLDVTTGQPDDAGKPQSVGKPEDAGRPDVNGLDRARQTPAADHLPSDLPGKPAEAGTGNSSAARAGVDRAAQTPAADYLPPFVPGPPDGAPTGQPGGSAGSVGTDIAKQTPAAGRLAR